MLTIRKAELSDIKIISTLSRETFYDTYHEFNVQEDMDLFMGKSFNDDAIANELNDEQNIFFIAEDDEQALGYALISTKEINEVIGVRAIEICRLYCVKDAIGKGVGYALMQTSLAYARQVNIEVVWLGVWEKNVRAIEFYKKNGFEKFGNKEFVLGKDVQNDWLMLTQIS